MKTQNEVEELLDLTDECRELDGMSYKEGVKATLEWVLGFGDAPYTEDEKEE